MKTILLALLALLTSLAALAQPAAPPAVPAMGRTLAAFIPAGYVVLDQATGDLNRDGRLDAALVLGAAAEHDTTELSHRNIPGRALLVLLGTPAGYALAAQSRKAVLGKDGSYNGDPFDGIAIKRGVLIIKHDVGGNWGRTTTARFRYQQGGVYLIGETEEYSRHAPDCDDLPYPPQYGYRDTNFITGEYEIIRTSEECRLLEKKRGKYSLKPLRKLADYAVAP